MARRSATFLVLAPRGATFLTACDPALRQKGRAPVGHRAATSHRPTLPARLILTLHNSTANTT
ncbi:MAG TPA: hypothetical protein PLS46_13615, partial [Microthrixaceae bacterium]|nr:hypothetical protein [Microthrixaceae bacterium]